MCYSFPLGSPDRGNRTMADEALESFGITIPLIEFHEIPSRCSNSSGAENTPKEDSKAKEAAESKTLDDGDDNDDLEENEKAKSITQPKKGKPRHPHVVTRCVLNILSLLYTTQSLLYLISTQLRVVDETHLFNRQAYNKAHKRLKASNVRSFIFILWISIE